MVLQAARPAPKENCQESVQGLKRIADDPELYAATTDEWAGLLPSDEGEIALLRPLLAGASLQTSPLRLAYDADQHGWNADAFHSKIDTYGAALVIAQTTGGAVLGGYNPLGKLLSSSSKCSVLQ